MLSTIRKGARGDAVKIAQYLTGYAGRGKASGIFDAAFEVAVKAWQWAQGLDADGIIGMKTWAKLAETAPVCSASKNRTSAAVCALQLALGGLEADGIFGARTRAALVVFQTAKGLKADGIAGPKTWTALLAGASEPAKGGFVQPKDFKQYDSRWAKTPYTATGSAKQTIRSSGCGPTAAADVVATLKDASVTPPVLAQLALKHGFRTANSGTAWGFFKFLAEKYGFTKFAQTTSIATLKACLDAGGYVVCSMGKGYWTNGGHYICAWKYDGTYIYCNDPASASRKKQKETQFVKEKKMFFCFWK